MMPDIKLQSVPDSLTQKSVVTYTLLNLGAKVSVNNDQVNAWTNFTNKYINNKQLKILSKPNSTITK